MQQMALHRAFTLIEPGPLVLLTTQDDDKPNIMTLSWLMVTDFTPRFALTTGAWNHSYRALQKTGECVIAIPAVDLLDQVIGIGTCSGVDTDKFTRFALTPLPASQVRAPLIGECLANIECRVVDFVPAHDIVVLQGVAAHVDSERKERRTVHSVGDGSFIVDGQHLERRAMMASKLPPGL